MQLLFAFVLGTDSNCIDVGAHTGKILAEFVRLAPEGKHIAYEPLPQMYERLTARFPDVDVRRAALSNATGHSTFRHIKNRPAYSGLKERTYPGPVQVEMIEVDTEELDRSLPSGYVPSLIKIDVEGAELEVIQGAIQTITTHKPIVVFEHGRGGSTGDIFELLSSVAGLRIFDIDGKGPYSLKRWDDRLAEGGLWNFVAHV